MPNRKVSIPRAELFFFYLSRNKSPTELGKRYGCTSSTIRNRIKEYRIPRKTKAQAHIRSKRKPFSGTALEMAYMVGFRLGDLNVYLPTKRSETIVARTHSTKWQQILVVKSLFEKYGGINVSRSRRNGFHINCYLDKSFEFLLPKSEKVPAWIVEDRNRFTAFLAGYIDAEGSFGVNQRRARFKIDSYDKNILLQTHKWLSKNGIRSRFWQIGWKGAMRPEGYEWNQDLWRITVNYAQDIYNFCVLIAPYLRHRKRIKDMKTVIANIKLRKEKGSIIWETAASTLEIS